MATATKLLLASFFLLLLRANCQTCETSSLEIAITNTGKRVGESDFVFEVEVKNKCRCTVVNVFLDSLGFASVTPVDPKHFRREGTGYLINDGKGIGSALSFKFQYAWNRAFKMSPSSFEVSC